MKKYKIVLSLLFIFLGIIGCNNTNENKGDSSLLYIDSIPDSDSLLTLNPPMRKGSFNFDSIIETTSFIPLETNDSILISKISDIKVLNDTLFIADYKLGKIFAFNNEGKNIGYINGKGEGPNQYRRLCSFDIDSKNKLLYLLDGDFGKVHIYESNMKLLHIIKLPYAFVDHLAVFDENKIFLEMGFREYNKQNKISPNLAIYDLIKNKINTTYFYFQNQNKIYFRNQDPIAFSHHNNKLYYWPPLGNSIYTFSLGTMIKSIKYNMKEYEIPLNLFHETKRDVISIMKEKKYAYIDCFYEFKNWYYARISRLTSSAHYFYNKSNQKGFLDVSFLKLGEYSKIIMPELFYISESLCCSYISPEQYMNLVKNTEIVNMDDNPILVIYKLKQ